MTIYYFLLLFPLSWISPVIADIYIRVFFFIVVVALDILIWILYKNVVLEVSAFEIV
jgi:hypothetical protein